jgi:Fur family transcriptional regulator, ferric uptake regulator
MRNTNARTHILDLLTASPVALSHSEVLTAIDGICDRVTVYRVLDRLAEEGRVHKIVNTDGTIKYAPCHDCAEKHSHKHDHVHFSCTNCLSVTCLTDVEPVYKLPRKYKVQEVNFTLSGLCPDCS